MHEMRSFSTSAWHVLISTIFHEARTLYAKHKQIGQITSARTIHNALRLPLAGKWAKIHGTSGGLNAISTNAKINLIESNAMACRAR